MDRFLSFARHARSVQRQHITHSERVDAHLNGKANAFQRQRLLRFTMMSWRQYIRQCRFRHYIIHRAGVVWRRIVFRLWRRAAAVQRSQRHCRLVLAAFHEHVTTRKNLRRIITAWMSRYWNLSVGNAMLWWKRVTSLSQQLDTAADAHYENTLRGRSIRHWSHYTRMRKQQRFTAVDMLGTVMHRITCRQHIQQALTVWCLFTVKSRPSSNNTDSTVITMHHHLNTVDIDAVTTTDVVACSIMTLHDIDSMGSHNDACSIRSDSDVALFREDSVWYGTSLHRALRRKVLRSVWKVWVSSKPKPILVPMPTRTHSCCSHTCCQCECPCHHNRTVLIGEEVVSGDTVKPLSRPRKQRPQSGHYLQLSHVEVLRTPLASISTQSRNNNVPSTKTKPRPKRYSTLGQNVAVHKPYHVNAK